MQITTVDAYVNLLTHCVKHEQVKELFFVGREALAGQEAELEELVRKIYARVAKLADEHSRSDYKSVQQYLPPENLIKDHIIRLDFVRPHQSVLQLRKRFAGTNEIIVDITGANKQLAGDIMVSFMANGFNHVCHFVLNDKVFSPEWKSSGKTLLYHDLIDDDGVTRYTYSDFSKSEPAISSFGKLRSQGKFVRFLLALSTLLALFLIALTTAQQTSITQVVAVTTFLTVLAGLLESFLSISKYFGAIVGK